jgi:hypothetical protein
MLPNIHISTNHLHRLLRNTCFSATGNEYFYSKNIRTLHVQISPFRLKYPPSSSLCAVDVRNNQFLVAHFHPIHLKGVSYTRFELIVGRNFGRNKGQFWCVGLLFMSINLTLRSVQSILPLIGIITSRETSKLKGKYNYHPIKSHLSWYLATQKETLTKFWEFFEM